MNVYMIPLLIIFILVYSRIKKVNAYENFVIGAKKGFNLGLEIFPYIAAILIAVALFKDSGLSTILTKVLSPVFIFLSIPPELCELIVLRPFTGSGSIALLNDIYLTYGTDSYISRCASTICGSSETLFYMITIYLSGTKIKKLFYAIPVALIVNFIAIIIACLLCKIM